MRAYVICFAVGLASLAVGWRVHATHIPEWTGGSTEATPPNIGVETWTGMSEPGLQAWLPIGAGLLLLAAAAVLWVCRTRPASKPRGTRSHPEGGA